MKPFAWSYSALTRFESCPKQYWHLNVEKDFKDVGSEFSAEGTLIHDALHKRVIKGQPLPIEMRHFEAMAKRFAEAPGEKKGEMKLALNRKMEPVDYFAHDVYLRVIIDLLIVRGDAALLVDWKTGKVKDDFTQMGLCAAVLSRWMPELKTIKTAYVWVKHKDISPKTYPVDSLAEVWADLLPRVDKIEQARKTVSFPAKPSGLCKYCPVSDCPHWNR